MLNVGRRVLVAIQRIVLAHGTGRAFERIVNADQLRGLGVIGSVAAADSKSCAAFVLVNCGAQVPCKLINRGRLSDTNGGDIYD